MLFETGKIMGDGSIKFISEGTNESLFGAKSVHAFEMIS